ncbi:hypothetical protein [Vibrio rarus]|uniref:hypothetical protein n=1 Tax=Vibrio rarus TaxID=413403 RepID=UPI0021C46108|nr:hypothetical protein [Vibrio rarus]
MKMFFLLAIIIMFNSGDLYAANLWLDHDGVYPTILRIEGEIVPSDYVSFKKIIKQERKKVFPLHVIQLSSPGGDLETAIKIASYVSKQSPFTTIIGSNDKCVSACAIIFFSAKYPISIDNNAVGLHQPYSVVNGKLVPAKKTYWYKRIITVLTPSQGKENARSLADLMWSISPENIAWVNKNAGNGYSIMDKNRIY